MDAEMIHCFSCGALVPNVDGPAHKYMLGSAGCWEIFGQLLARDYSEFNYPPVHRLVVDAYAVQHPGKPTRQAIQSVIVDLIGLYFSIEKGMEAKLVTRAIGRATEFSADFVWLEPPASLGAVTVTHAAHTSSLEEYDRAGRAWAESAWGAWSGHRDRIIELSRL